MKYKLKKPLPFAPKGTKVKVRYVPIGLYEIIIYAQDGEHHHEVDIKDIPEWMKFLKPYKKGK